MNYRSILFLFFLGFLSTTSIFLFGAPAITSLNSNFGTITGGNTVTIMGSEFTGATAVNFGNIPATSFSVINDNQINAVAPSFTSNNIG